MDSWRIYPLWSEHACNKIEKDITKGALVWDLHVAIDGADLGRGREKSQHELPTKSWSGYGTTSEGTTAAIWSVNLPPEITVSCSTCPPHLLLFIWGLVSNISSILPKLHWTKTLLLRFFWPSFGEIPLMMLQPHNMPIHYHSRLAPSNHRHTPDQVSWYLETVHHGHTGSGHQ